MKEDINKCLEDLLHTFDLFDHDLLILPCHLCHLYYLCLLWGLLDWLDLSHLFALLVLFGAACPIQPFGPLGPILLVRSIDPITLLIQGDLFFPFVLVDLVDLSIHLVHYGHLYLVGPELLSPLEPTSPIPSFA